MATHSYYCVDFLGLPTELSTHRSFYWVGSIVRQDCPDPSAVQENTMSTDTNSRPLSIAVLEHVAQSKSVDPAVLPPLNDAIDPDVLDALYIRKPTGEQRTGTIAISFTYANCIVSIHSPNSIDVQCAD